MIGKGNTAEVIEYGKGKVCKLFYKGYPKEYVALEYQNAKEMYKSQIMVPKAFEIVNIEGRSGIIYEKIDGKPLWDFLNEENSDSALETFVELHRKLLDHHSENIMSYKEFLTAIVKNKTDGNPLLLNQISTLPNGDCICHGDFHPGNVLIKSDGTAVIIDFMNVCKGPFLFDIARTFFLLGTSHIALANQYLEKMKVSKTDIAEYSLVIEKCRAYE